MPPDEPTDEERQQQLPQDGQTPFQPADPPRDPDAPADSSAQPTSSDDSDTTHPVTDSDVDPQEAYDAGLPEATGADEPNAGNAVTGYDEPEDVQPS